jgi:predicted SnoaL-like aldol condensation-catalyzing enzyme
MIRILSFVFMPLCISSLAFSVESKDKAKNVDIVTNFYSLAFKEHKVVEAAERFLDPNYIQHNPNVPDGRKPFVDFFVPFFKANKEARAEVKRVIADGDLVVLHVHSKMTAADRGRAIVDIFRVKGNRIVEHWDVIQAIPEKSANNNTMF